MNGIGNGSIYSNQPNTYELAPLNPVPNNGGLATPAPTTRVVTQPVTTMPTYPTNYSQTNYPQNAYPQDGVTVIENTGQDVYIDLTQQP